MQPGFPVVNVTLKGKDIILTQERYMLPYKLKNDTSKWFVPVSIWTSKKIPNTEIPEYWLKDEITTIRNIDTDVDFIFININRTAYYRVNYDSRLWKNLIENFEKIPQISRAQLVDDAFALARSQHIDYSIPMKLSTIIKNYLTDDLTWWAFDNGIEFLTRVIRGEIIFENYRTVMRDIFSKQYEILGFEEQEQETHRSLLHRSKMIKQACYFGVEKCLESAKFKFQKWMTGSLSNGYMHIYINIPVNIEFSKN